MESQVMTPGAAAVDFAGPRIATKILPFVLESFADEIELEDLAREAGMTRFNFCRRFHKECGVTPMRWLWSFRTILAAEFIGLDPKWSLTDVAFACGFTSSAHFSRSFRAMFKTSPSAFRKDALLRDDGSTRQAGLLGDNRGLVARAAQAAIASA